MRLERANNSEGIAVSWLPPISSQVSAVRSLKKPSGRLLSWFSCRLSFVKPVRPDKSPACNSVRPAPDRLRESMADRCAAVTSPQVLTGTNATIESRTALVRSHTDTPSGGTSVPNLSTNTKKSENSITPLPSRSYLTWYVSSPWRDPNFSTNAKKSEKPTIPSPSKSAEGVVLAET